jgi:hypothetical protein
VAAFRPVKSKWKDAVLSWQTQNPNKVFTKENFAPILEGMFKNIDLEPSVKNGFRATGLYPWNANAVNFSKCIGKNGPNVNANNTSLIQPLPYNDFCEIVGERRIETFKNK